MVGLENLDGREAKAAAQFTPSPSENLIDRLAWWYTVCRERLLQDDTESIVQILASFGLKLRTYFGARASYLWRVGKVLVEPSLRAAWEHEYKYSNLPITAGFAGIPGPSDTFYGPSEGHDSAIVSAGVSVQWRKLG
jgi:hypothetical protein